MRPPLRAGDAGATHLRRPLSRPRSRPALRDRPHPFLDRARRLELEPLYDRAKALLVARACSDRFHEWLGGLDARVRDFDDQIPLKVKRQNHLDSGLPHLGLAYLHMRNLDPQGRYTAKASRIADLLLARQTVYGGWGPMIRIESYLDPDYLGDSYDTGPNRPLDARVKGPCAFEKGSLREGATPTTIRFLIALNTILDDRRIDIRIRRGLAFLIGAQRENGAWPGRVGYDHEIGFNYHAWDTFNDGTINECVAALIAAYRRDGSRDCLNAIVKAGAFIAGSAISREVGPDGRRFRQYGWAQHYWQGKPVPGRRFEPAAIASRETAMNAQTLMDIHAVTGDDALLDHARRALDYLKRCRLTGRFKGRVPMFLEIGTNAPLFPVDPTPDLGIAAHVSLVEASRTQRFSHDPEVGEVNANGYGYFVQVEDLWAFHSWAVLTGDQTTAAWFREAGRKQIERRFRMTLRQTRDGIPTDASGIPEGCNVRPTLPGRLPFFIRSCRDYLAWREGKMDWRWEN